MFVKSSCDKNIERVNLNRVNHYYPVDDVGISQIVFKSDNYSVIWNYDSQVDRNIDFAQLDKHCQDLGSLNG